MRATVSPNGQALYLFDDDDPVVPKSWYTTIYKDVSEYLADQLRPETVKPRQTAIKIDQEAIWGGK